MGAERWSEKVRAALEARALPAGEPATTPIGAPVAMPDKPAVVAAVLKAIEAPAAEIPAKPAAIGGWWARLKAFIAWARQVGELLAAPLAGAAEEILGAGTGAAKREAVLDAAEEIYRQSGVDVPVLPQAVEVWILRWIVGSLVDLVVAEVNKSVKATA